MNTVKSLKIFVSADGDSPFLEWYNSLKDEKAQAIVKARLARVRLGNLGNFRSVGGGVQELKFSFGAGFRIYFSQIGNSVVILLGGGDKRSQNEDIRKAKQNWKEYKEGQRSEDY